jgi:hypothetical protein
MCAEARKRPYRDELQGRKKDLGRNSLDSIGTLLSFQDSLSSKNFNLFLRPGNFCSSAFFIGGNSCSEKWQEVVR